jgi:hypothetical protein
MKYPKDQYPNIVQHHNEYKLFEALSKEFNIAYGFSRKVASDMATEVIRTKHRLIEEEGRK